VNAVAIGEKLKKLRGDVTQRKVANDVDISVSALSMYETGKRIPRDEVKLRLSEYYGVSIEKLFFTQ
jgi:transcriptional regulator with XRE-family HTH domain